MPINLKLNFTSIEVQQYLNLHTRAHIKMFVSLQSNKNSMIKKPSMITFNEKFGWKKPSGLDLTNVLTYSP